MSMTTPRSKKCHEMPCVVAAEADSVLSALATPDCSMGNWRWSSPSLSSMIHGML